MLRHVIRPHVKAMLRTIDTELFCADPLAALMPYTATLLYVMFLSSKITMKEGVH